MPPLVRYSAAWGFVRACAYYLSMIVSGALLTVGMLLTWPIVHLYDPTLFTYQLWTMALARLCLQPLTTIRVKGVENLPKGPFVIVSNHQSFIDPSICSYPLATVNFKCLYKTELHYYPFIGSALYLAGHIAVKRSSKDSGKDALEKAGSWIARGCSVLFFAEGTTKSKLTPGGPPLGPFKLGAFIVAQRAQVPIVPITISGARSLLPSTGLIPRFNDGDTLITVHAPVMPPLPGVPLDTFAEATRLTVASALRPVDEVPRVAGVEGGAGSGSGGGSVCSSSGAGAVSSEGSNAAGTTALLSSINGGADASAAAASVAALGDTGAPVPAPKAVEVTKKKR